MWVLYHLASRLPALAELRRCLRAGRHVGDLRRLRAHERLVTRRTAGHGRVEPLASLVAGHHGQAHTDGETLR